MFGVVAADVVLRVQRIPASGDHVNAEALGWRIGGSSANVACGLAAAGYHVRLVGPAAGASVALIAVLPAGHPAAARRVAIILAAAVLAAAAISATLPLADRYTVTTVNGGKANGRTDRWCTGLLIATIVTLIVSAA